MSSILDYLKKVDEKNFNKPTKKTIIIQRSQKKVKEPEKQQEQVQIVQQIKKPKNRLDHAGSILDGLEKFKSEKITQKDNKLINHANDLL